MEKGTWYKIFLCVVLLGVFVWAAIDPVYFDDWLLENVLVFIFIPLILLAGRYFKLSNISYTLITIFLILHLIGSHYTYSGVPFSNILSVWFNTQRNMYDRLVHFCFGLLIAYPIREIFMRIAKTKGIWAYYLPIELTLAFSVLYEFIEWGAVVFVNPQAGIAFIGAQGDIWDAQKDMFMAFIGSIIAMIVTFSINLWLNKSFWKELKDSLKVPKKDSPLGEVKIAKMIRNG